MKIKKKSALKISVILMAILILTLSITAVIASASGAVVEVGEMVDINAKFSSYKVQDTVRTDDGGYVGDYQYTVFYDSAKGSVKSGYEGTPVVIYTVNHPAIERIGTDSNETIIKSMLDRGYVVVVLDYPNSAKAVSPAIENSTQAFRTNLRKGSILKASLFPSGEYHENFLAPSGFNVRLNEVFWEIDKHSTSGTLDKIVENWNSDFRATKGGKLIKWVHTDGTRKAVQNGFDGNAPVWYNSDGSKNEASGQYTYIKFTKAEAITDCVDPDGSFIDMNLYINIVYPTSPEKEVPVMSLANSSGHPTTSVTGADLRPHSNGFLYNGYANVVFDYLWVPMARSASWGYYDGSQGVTQDHMNYAVMMYNDKLVNTAAMRYLRYISLAGGDTYNFDLDAFGVYGNSKGGWFSYLGEKNIQSALVDASKYSTTAELEHAISIALENLVPDRYYDGHHGETRYSVGAGSLTADGFTVKAGEKQPWLTYNGTEIISGVQFTNPCNGSQQEDITAGHAPMFISGNMTDTYNAAFGYSNDIYNICRELDIPILQFEVPIGHTLTSGMDMNYNLDTYDAYFRYVNYFLRGDAIDGKTALKAAVTTPSAYGVSVYYNNVTHIFTYPKVTGGEKTTADNYGRRYTIAFDVYDTTERVLQLKLNWMTNRTGYGTIDYNHVIRNVKTKANGWTHVEFTYDVYEPDYGFPSANNTQSLAVYASPDGDTNAPMYFDNLTADETVTDITVGTAFVAERNDGTGAYTAPVSTSPFAVYNGETKIGDYAGWAAALGAYKSGYIVKLQRDYTLTDADLSDAIGSFATVNLDFGTYTVTCENTKNSLLWAKATNTTATVINVTGGAFRLGRTPLISYESATAAGSGKVFSFNFNGTYVGFAENAWATEIISDVDTTSNVSVKSNISLSGCTLDFDDSLHSKDSSVVFPAPTTKSLTVNYTLTGGEIKLSSQRWVTILENAKIVEFKKAGDGNYTTLVMPESITVAVSGSYLLEDGYAAYEKDSVTDNMATYKPVKSANSTKYGIITSTYADADAYTIILFKDGVMISAHQTLASAITAANDILGNASYADSQAEILFRKSMENTAEPSYGSTAGTLLIDLGGYTLKRNKVIINAVVTSSTPMFETNVIFRNGRLETPSNVMGVTHCLYTTDNVKTFNITFDEVTFGFASGATGLSSSFWTIWQNGHTTVIDTNLTFKNCTFDLYNNKPAKTGTLFTFSVAQAECDAVVEGGEIIGNGSGITLFGTDNADSVLLKKNSNGEYLKFTSKDSGTPVVDNFRCDDGKYRNFQATDNGYELKENNLATPYGIITNTYADESTYPFVVFKEDGTVLGGYKYFSGNNGGESAIGAAKEYVKQNVFNVETGKFTVDKYKAYIVLRRNYTLLDTEAGDSFSEYNDNLAQIRGDVTIDLGGFTLSQNPTDSKNYSLFPATSKRWEQVTISDGTKANYTFPSTITVINGKLNVSENAVIKYNTTNTSDANKVFTFNFNNVTFGLTANATTQNLLVQYDITNYAAGLVINVNDCTFDLNTNAPSNAITLINTNNTLSEVNTKFTFNGTQFLADDLSKITLATTAKPSNVSVKLIKGEISRYGTLKTLSANTPNTSYLVSDIGNMYFVKHEVNGTAATYYLDNLTTPYGTVPHSKITADPTYLSAIDYPFFVFQNGSFVRVDETYMLAVSHIKDLAKGSASASKSAEIVLRRDYKVQTKVPRVNGTTADDVTWNLFYLIGGTMVFDLNGNSLIRADKPIIDVSSNTDESKAYKTTLVFKNGNIVISGNQLMGADNDGNLTEAKGKKVWDISFSDVNFSYAEGSTAKTMLAATWTSGTGFGSDLYFTLNNCVIDMTNAPAGVTLINASDVRSNGSGCVDYVASINGGKIIGYDTVPTIFKSNTGDSITFGKYNGEYLGISLPASASHPTNTFTATGGASISFGKYETNGSYVLYRLGEDIKTAHGNIPFRYQSVQDYPFIVFGENKNFVGADDTFLDITKSYDNDGAFNAAKVYLTSNVWDG